MKPYLLIIIVLQLPIVFSSCTRMILNLTGFKKPKIETRESIESFLNNKCALGIEDTYALDTVLYEKLLTSPFKPGWDKSFRPVQFRIYDKTGSPVVHWSSCEGYLKDLGTFDTVPPRNINTLDSTLNLSEDLSRYFTLDGTPAELKIPEGYDFYIVIYFARFAYKLSRETIASVYEYVEKHPELNIKVYKINVDVLDWWDSEINTDITVKRYTAAE